MLDKSDFKKVNTILEKLSENEKRYQLVLHPTDNTVHEIVEYKRKHDHDCWGVIYYYDDIESVWYGTLDELLKSLEK